MRHDPPVRPQWTVGGWVVLAVLCVSLLLIGMDVTVLHVAAPSLTVATYRANHALPPRLPEAATSAAKESLAAAVHHSGGLHTPAAEALREAARAAFVTALGVAASSAALLLLAVAVMTAMWLRPPRGRTSLRQVTRACHRGE